MGDPDRSDRDRRDHSAAEILEALALQKQADQEKRAKILQSEGIQQSAINLADGDAKAAIRAAEGQRQAAILRAEGARQAFILEAEGKAEAIASVYNAIRAANPDPSLIAILQLETLAKFAESDNTKIVVPFESAALLGAAQALKSVMEGFPRTDERSRAPARPRTSIFASAGMFRALLGRVDTPAPPSRSKHSLSREFSGRPEPG